MGRDANTPEWVQHIAFKVDSVATLEAVKARLEANGVPVVGITDHTIFKSIYFFDPNGHRLELAADTATADMNARLDAVKWAMLDEWAQTKRAPRHAAWMHEGRVQGRHRAGAGSRAETGSSPAGRASHPLRRQHGAADAAQADAHRARRLRSRRAA